MTNAPPPTAEFLQLRDKSFMDDDTSRTARWRSVLATARSADITMIEVLVRLAFQTNAPASGHRDEGLAKAFAKFGEDIRAQDTTFEPSRQKREMQVMAAAVLVHLFATDANAPLAVLTASIGGARKLDLPLDIVGLAENAIGRLASARRAELMVGLLKFDAPDIDYELEEDAVGDHTAQDWKNELEALRDATDAVVKSMAQAQNRVLDAIVEHTRVSDEETQMLWWLTNGISVDLGIPFGRLEAAACPLVLASELAALTYISPGPPAIRALLSRAGLGARKVAVSAALSALPTDWVDRATSAGASSAATTPIHFALEERTRLGSADAWLPGWSALTGLPRDFTLPALTLAEQFYRERVLLSLAV